MDINFISRQNLHVSTRTSKYKPVLQAIEKLKANGKVVEISYEDESELNSLRNVVYRYNKEKGEKVKSSTHPDENIVFFYK